MNSYDIGDLVELRFAVSDQSGDPMDAGSLTFRLRAPDGTITVKTLADTSYITHTGVGTYQVQIEVEESGKWSYRWEADEPDVAEDGSFAVREEPFSPPAVTDLRDTRVMIPRMRRALLGAHANTPNAELLDNLTDSEVNAIIADSLAEIILYSGSAFGKTLEVAERDSFYQAPVAWRASSELTEIEATIICTQGALTFFFQALKNTKSSETITRGDETWSYTMSANVLQEQIQMLRAARDAAIEQLRSEAVLDVWINTLGVRDRFTDMLIEPWADQAGVGGTIEVAFPDFRFGTVDYLPA